MIWDAPVPYRKRPDLHLGVIRPQHTPRVRDVTGHSFGDDRVALTTIGGFPLTSPASTFVTLGELPLTDLVAIGDYFVRKYRPGHGRRDVDKPPLATLDELAGAVALGRWAGVSNLRKALDLVREDSWSRRESWLRVTLVTSGLPEPDLNVDIYDDAGCFVGCADLVYKEFKLAIDYHGKHHSVQFAKDLERVERFKDAGWEHVVVTKIHSSQMKFLLNRIRRKLRERGWTG